MLLHHDNNIILDVTNVYSDYISNIIYAIRQVYQDDKSIASLGINVKDLYLMYIKTDILGDIDLVNKVEHISAASFKNIKLITEDLIFRGMYIGNVYVGILKNVPFIAIHPEDQEVITFTSGNMLDKINGNYL